MSIRSLCKTQMVYKYKNHCCLICWLDRFLIPFPNGLNLKIQSQTPHLWLLRRSCSSQNFSFLNDAFFRYWNFPVFFYLKLKTPYLLKWPSHQITSQVILFRFIWTLFNLNSIFLSLLLIAKSTNSVSNLRRKLKLKNAKSETFVRLQPVISVTLKLVSGLVDKASYTTETVGFNFRLG